jgi:hypothetical protein
MYISRKQLNQIIKEELEGSIKEVFGMAHGRKAARLDREFQRTAAENPDLAIAMRKERLQKLYEAALELTKEMALIGLDILDPIGILGWPDLKDAYDKLKLDPGIDNLENFLDEFIMTIPLGGKYARTAGRVREFKDNIERAKELRGAVGRYRAKTAAI